MVEAEGLWFDGPSALSKETARACEQIDEDHLGHQNMLESCPHARTHAQEHVNAQTLTRHNLTQELPSMIHTSYLCAVGAFL